MSDLWLSKDELATLTGFRWKSKQAGFLKAKKIPHTINSFGHPLVVRATIERLGGVDKARRTKEPAGPNWAAKGLD